MASLLREVRLLLSIPSLFLFVATLVTGAGLLTLQPDRPFFWIPAGLAFSFLFRYGLSMSFAVVLGELSAFLITGHSTLHGLASGLASIVSVLPLVYRPNHLKISREDHMWRRFMLAFLIALPVGTTLRFLTNDVGWIEWYMRVFTGVLFPGLPLLLWSRSSRFSGDAGLWERVAVTTVFLLSLPVVFFDNIVPFLPLPYAYLPAMLVIWIALRMGDFSGAAAMLLLGLAAFPGGARAVIGEREGTPERRVVAACANQLGENDRTECPAGPGQRMIDGGAEFSGRGDLGHEAVIALAGHFVERLQGPA
ncbi:MAG: hypothetical protein CVV45_19205, partial [Spirochaetae bacterium HGW-Spirochaetae-10]